MKGAEGCENASGFMEHLRGTFSQHISTFHQHVYKPDGGSATNAWQASLGWTKSSSECHLPARVQSEEEQDVGDQVTHIIFK